MRLTSSSSSSISIAIPVHLRWPVPKRRNSQRERDGSWIRLTHTHKHLDTLRQLAHAETRIRMQQHRPGGFLHSSARPRPRPLARAPHMDRASESAHVFLALIVCCVWWPANATCCVGTACDRSLAHWQHTQSECVDSNPTQGTSIKPSQGHARWPAHLWPASGPRAWSQGRPLINCPVGSFQHCAGRGRAASELSWKNARFSKESHWDYHYYYY